MILPLQVPRAGPCMENTAQPQSRDVPDPAGVWARLQGSSHMLVSSPHLVLRTGSGCCPPVGDRYSWQPGFWLANVYLKMPLCINPKYFPPQLQALCERNLPVQTEENLYLV